VNANNQEKKKELKTMNSNLDLAEKCHLIIKEPGSELKTYSTTSIHHTVFYKKVQKFKEKMEQEKLIRHGKSASLY
jgi:hypothetical protein